LGCGKASFREIKLYEETLKKVVEEEDIGTNCKAKSNRANRHMLGQQVSYNHLQYFKIIEWTSDKNNS
jgi:hypothetical protein